MSINEITGAKQSTKPASEEYLKNYERIFSKSKMKTYKVPIDFELRANSAEEAKIRLEEFLLRAVTEFRLDYNVVNYEAPYGYPAEEVPSS